MLDTEQLKKINQLIIKCLKDKEFKTQFLKTPKSLLEKETGETLPPHDRIQVVEDTDKTLNILLPDNEVLDEELAQISGGMSDTDHVINTGIKGFLMSGLALGYAIKTIFKVEELKGRIASGTVKDFKFFD